MQRINVSYDEIMILRESVHGATLKGVHAPLVGKLLEKIYKAQEKAEESLKDGNNSPDVLDIPEGSEE